MKYNVGLLFVHGIGEQTRGDTMIAFGEPLICWLDDWLRGHGAGQARFTEAELKPSRTPDLEPAAATVVVERKMDSRVITSQWLLQESWWAGDFRRPPFTAVAGWLLSTGFWSILSHAGRSFYIRKHSWWVRIWNIAKIAAAIPLGWLLQIVVVLVAMLAWVPIPKMRQALSAMLLRISGTLGDSYILLESPIQAAAALTVTTQNINRLAQECDQVVVIAHSQGAALAHMALREIPPANVRLLITFGSGLAKLDELKQTETRRRIALLRNAASASLLLLLLLPRWIQLARAGSGEFFDPLFVCGLVPAILLLIVVADASQQWERFSTDWPKTLSLEPVLWSDFYASSDPVPNGPIVVPDDKIKGFKSHQLTNRGSLISDHSSYWTNRDEFVPAVLRRIDDVLGCGLFGEHHLQELDAASSRRRPRVMVLAGIRYVCFGSALLALWSMGSVLPVHGERVLAELRNIPLSRPIADLLVSVGLVFGSLARLVSPLDPKWVTQFGHAAIGGSLPIAVIWLWYRFVAFTLWRAWDRRQAAWLCDPRSAPQHRADRLVLPVLGVAIGVIPAAMSIAAHWWPDYGVLGLLVLDSVVATLRIVALLCMFGVALALAWDLISTIRKSAIAVIRWVMAKRQESEVDAKSKAAGE